jgi:hypothetical protein
VAITLLSRGTLFLMSDKAKKDNRQMRQHPSETPSGDRPNAEWGAVVAEAAKLAWEYRWPFLQLSAALTLPLLALALATHTLVGGPTNDSNESVLSELLAGGDRASHMLAMLFGYAIAVWVVQSVLQFLAQIAFLIRALQILEGEARRPLTTTFWITLRRLPSVIVTALLLLAMMLTTLVPTALAVWLFSHVLLLWLGTIALGVLLWWVAPSFRSRAVGWALTIAIPFGLVFRLGVLFSLAVPLTALGQQAYVKALQESARQVAGRWWTVALVTGVIGLLAQAVSSVVEYALDASLEITGLSGASWATGAAAWTISAPLVTLGWMLLLGRGRVDGRTSSD